MEHMAELGTIVTGFNITEQCIDYMCGKELLKLINAMIGLNEVSSKFRIY